MKAYLGRSGCEAHPEGQELKAHLEQVSRRAADAFTDPFMSECARWIGRYHDAGKYKPEFQARITGRSNERVDHSTLGARLLFERSHRHIAAMLAMPVLGHHGGIPNGRGHGDGGRSMEMRLADPLPEQAVRAFDGELGEAGQCIAPPPPRLVVSPATAAFEQYMAIHMLHAALVDADHLDAEAFDAPEQAALRGRRPDLTALTARYDDYMKQKNGSGEGAIQQIRADILAQCLGAAELEPGFFSLSVPTGGGKTLSSLGFALHHAQANAELRRIVYAIPFTSIIEQNAKVFRDVLGDEAVLEHHSAVGDARPSDRLDRAADNWDAPLIVTTNVQLFESLFSNRPSRCRKLHNLQGSVIILDEMQALPDALLKPCLMALHSLVTNYHATVVICTATQPDYSRIWPQQPDVREIIADVDALFARMRRTHAENLGALDDDALVQRLQAHEQVLVIVNNRAHAKALHRGLGGEAMGAYHLSTLMCPEHRTKKLDEIRHRLQNGLAVKLISTSLIEAGVDVDFPVVYRAAAGLDSIAQAAGRCNRNMRNPLAPVYVFTPVNWKAPGEVSRLANMALSEIAPDYPDMLCREALSKFFGLRFGAGAELDKKGILASIAEIRDGAFPFACIANAFNMIQSAGEAVFIPYDDQAREWIAQLERAEYPGALLRKLQRYSINVYPNQRAELESRGYLRDIGGALVLDVSMAQQSTIYTDDTGLDPFGSLAFQVY